MYNGNTTIANKHTFHYETIIIHTDLLTQFKHNSLYKQNKTRKQMFIHPDSVHHASTSTDYHSHDMQSSKQMFYLNKNTHRKTNTIIYTYYTKIKQHNVSATLINTAVKHTAINLNLI